MEITEHCQAEKEQSSKAQGGIGKATDLLISEEGISFYGHHAGQIGVNGKTIIVGWVWMEKKQNSLTGEVYANFKSIYADECIRGMQIVDDLFEKSIEYAR